MQSRTFRIVLFAFAFAWFFAGQRRAPGAEGLRIAAFNVDATPPLGSPVAYAPTRSIVDPLSARGIVLLGAGKPIVLCAVDWIGIANEGQDAWKEKLAQAAGTTAERVAVHTLHQHDAPRCDFTAAALLEEQGLAERRYDVAFARAVIQRTAKALRQAVERPRPVTHIGTGQAKVEKVASNRRILGPDGKVKLMRWTASRNPEAVAAPEGVIDPYLKLVSFWHQDEPIVSITYYATHPQSYYGDGDVSCDFVGIARNSRQKEVPEAVHIHFNGAGGNIGAGKYNDGSPENRPVLAERLRKGMQAAWQSQKKSPVSAEVVRWRVVPVKLPPAEHLNGQKLRRALTDPENDLKTRLSAAADLAWLQRVRSGRTVALSCLRLGEVYILHMPGELFVEYQLAAQKMRPEATVCMAAYGEYGCGYIGTAIAYTQGGYETSPRASNVAPEVEQVLTAAMRKLLNAGD